MEGCSKEAELLELLQAECMHACNAPTYCALLHGPTAGNAAHFLANSTARRCAPMKERLKYFTAACESATLRKPTNPNWREVPSLQEHIQHCYGAKYIGACMRRQ